MGNSCGRGAGRTCFITVQGMYRGATAEFPVTAASPRPTWPSAVKLWAEVVSCWPAAYC
jgi:hypothetical protein